MNATPPNTRERACWCPRCKEEGRFHTEALTAVQRLICESCGYPIAHAHCSVCGTSSVLEQPVLEPGGTWECGECGKAYPVPTDFLENAVVFSLRHQGDDAPLRMKTGRDAWRGVIRMMLALAILIWIYYQFIYDWPE